MEIYFEDLSNITDKYIEKTEREYKVSDYAIEDNCYDLVFELRQEIHTRLIENFNEMVDFEEEYGNELDPMYIKESFRKLINEL